MPALMSHHNILALLTVRHSTTMGTSFGIRSQIIEAGKCIVLANRSSQVCILAGGSDEKEHSLLMVCQFGVGNRYSRRRKRRQLFLELAQLHLSGQAARPLSINQFSEKRGDSVI